MKTEPNEMRTPELCTCQPGECLQQDRNGRACRRQSERPAMSVANAELRELHDATAQFLAQIANDGLHGIGWLWTGEGKDKTRERVGKALAAAFRALEGNATRDSRNRSCD